MSEKGQEPKLDVSMWPDSRLRPWTIDDELEAKIDDENLSLDDRVLKTSGSKLAGCRGQSVLDKKPDSFIEFEKMIEDKNWLYKLGTDAENVERDAILAELAKHMNLDEATGEEKEGDGSANPETNLALAGKMDDDKLLLNSILDFNSAMYDAAGAAEGIDEVVGEAGRPSTADDANLTFLETRLSRKPRKKKSNPAYSLGAIKYKPRKNPAVLNISTNAFQELLERHNMTPKGLGKSKSTSSLHLGSDGRATYNSQSKKQQQQQQQQQQERRQAAGNAGGGGVFSTEDLLGLDKETLVALLLQERMANITSPTQSRPQSADPTLGAVSEEAKEAKPSSAGSGSGAATTLLTAVPEEKETHSGGATDPAVLSLLEKPSSKPPSRQNVVLDPIEIPTSPIKPSSASGSARAPSESGTGGLSLLATAKNAGSADLDLLASPGGASAGDSLLMSPSGAEPKVALTSARQTAVNKDGRQTPGDFAPTPRGTTPMGRPGTGLSKSASTSSISDKRAKAAKQGGKGLEGLSVSSTMGTTGSLSKARIAEIRSLRDYMMTVSGAFAMNVNPDASPSAQQEVAESIAVTKDMVKETVRKNRIDQTWTLLSTPGYYDAVGPAEIFKSDVNKNFISDDKFDQAVKNADVALGIKTSPLRVWSENGIKNKIKIFQSGGALRT